MSKDYASTRRKFLKQLTASSALLAAGPFASVANQEQLEERIIRYQKPISANDTIRIGIIGTGIMGHNDLQTALKVPGIELAGACDLYTGRLERIKELYGSTIYTTQDYRELLNKKDIDAVIIATSDHWHARIATDAFRKNKHVYCEKPMVHKLWEGLPLIGAQRLSKKVMQVGSQRVSSMAYIKAKELYKAGEIGALNCVEATYDRQSAIGAWEYTMPTDASPQTVDWRRYISGMPQIPFDPKKFFWWRNYKAFGTGMAGDLFVHLLSGIHMITDSKGPTRIVSSGQLSYWKDGRDVPDVMTAIMDYPQTKEHPAFQVMLRVNFISGGGNKSVIRLYGTEGMIEMEGNGFTVTHSLLPKAPGIGGYDALNTYPTAMQEELKKQYSDRWTKDDEKRPEKAPVKYKMHEGYSEHLDHFTNFFDAIRNGTQANEGPEFAFRAAAPCLAANDSYFTKRIIYWDPLNMRLKGA
ncbi:oxidoreductase [Niastella vici]|uniref:Oxidoreductase n=1 Tax=Niastella vici TaxID=1703345 RepID=A0A1V9FUR3_9BACT|nr:Gfo/Idh/MocA family oxidoreductase [Niastella vici]OQP62071.1 oxidoreductase [Niastella vici]